MSGRKGLLVLIVAAGILGTVGTAAAQETVPASDSPAATADLQEPQAKPVPPNPEPEHTGLAAVVFKTGADFKAFPRRKSTWVILGIGGAAAALAHPADNAVNRRLKSNAAGNFFAPGKYVGSVYVQLGTAAGLYTIGRYILPESKDGKRTNKVSHLGFDLLRAASMRCAGTARTEKRIRSRRDTRARRLPQRRCSSATSATVGRGRRSRLPATSPLHACTTMCTT
jgi:hypothetical protein